MPTLKQAGHLELAKRSIPGSLGQILLIAILVIFTDYRVTHPGLLWGFALLATALNLVRLFLSIEMMRGLPERVWDRWFGLSVDGTGLLWGVLFFLILKHQGLTHYDTTVALLIGSGISASIINSMSPDRRHAQIFISLTLGIPFAGLVMRMEVHAAGLALIFLTYYVFLSLQLEIHYRNFWNREKAGARLRDERNRLQDVVDAIPGLVFWTDATLRYRGVNRTFSRVFGTDDREVMGKEISSKITDAALLERIQAFATSDADHSTSEIPLSNGNGRRRWNLLVMRKTAPPAEDTSGPEIYIICIDIHELKEARLELEQQRMKSELTSKLAALGEITANVAHELKNPLSAIYTSLELMKRIVDSPAPDMPRLQTLVSRSLGTCGRVERIAANLKGFSRKTEGEPYVLAGLADIIQDSVELVQQQFRTNRVTLHVGAVDKTLSICCRPIEISQVFVNLLSNALDATKNQPEERWVRIEVVPERDSAVIRIVDSGNGIPTEIAERIFTPFFTTKAAGTGTGLGLSISRRILERHGATIALDRGSPHTAFAIRIRTERITRKSA